MADPSRGAAFLDARAANRAAVGAIDPEDVLISVPTGEPPVATPDEPEGHPGNGSDPEAEAIASVEQLQAEMAVRYSSVWTPSDKPGWPVPVDWWGDGAEELPEMDYRFLPPAGAPYAMDQAKLRGVDPAQTFLNSWVVWAACIRESIYVQMMAEDSGWKEHARLWAAVEGDASTRKQAGQDCTTRYLKELDIPRYRQYQAEIQEHELAMRFHEKAMAKYVQAGNPNAERPVPPAVPMCSRLWTDDVTKEGNGKILSIHDRGKWTIIRPEVAGWWGSMGAYSGDAEKDRSDWLVGYDGVARHIDRSTSGLSYYCPSWSVCILGGIQPSVWAKIRAKQPEDGMCQRFMIVRSKPAVEGEERKPDYAAERLWKTVLKNLIDMLAPTEPVRFSPEAQEYRKEKGRWLYRAMGSGVNAPLVAALGKWEGLLGRLCITAHCVGAAAKGQAYPDPLIPVAVIQQCWLFIEQVLWPHAINFYMRGDDEQNDLIIRVCLFILAEKRTGDTFSVRDMNNFRDTYGKFTGPERAKFWDAMESSGWLGAGSGISALGHHKTSYQINPRVFDGRFGDLGERERARRRDKEEHFGPIRRAFQARQAGEDSN